MFAFSFLCVTLLGTLVEESRSNRVSRYLFHVANALHRLNAHAINCTSTADILKKMSFFFSFFTLRILVNSYAVCPLFPLSFLYIYILFFNWKNLLRLRQRLGRFDGNIVYVPTRGNIHMYTLHVQLSYFYMVLRSFGSHGQVYAAPSKLAYAKVFRKVSFFFLTLFKKFIESSFLRDILIANCLNCVWGVSVYTGFLRNFFFFFFFLVALRYLVCL